MPMVRYKKYIAMSWHRWALTRSACPRSGRQLLDNEMKSVRTVIFSFTAAYTSFRSVVGERGLSGETQEKHRENSSGKAHCVA